MHRVPLVVFSHLRWDFVWQRPQHVMTRLGARRDVLFVEEPIVDGPPRLAIEQVADGVRVARPHLIEPGPAFGAKQQPTMVHLLRDFLRSERWDTVAAWLYTPMAVRIARALEPQVMVYDCMDQLANFQDAPPELLEREDELLLHADVVLTGGPSLYRDKSRLHRFVRCFPSSVDVAHFASASCTQPPAEQSHLAVPRLGYYGVIDERLDYELIAAIADAHPEWSVVMVGPVVKVDPARLPQRPNIHWLGQRAYEQLPAYVGDWDVCLMPFAINEATKFISPTKVLEYMAADRPIVSTPIADVAEPYGGIVAIADGAGEFIAACERMLAEDDAARTERRTRAHHVLQHTSWDNTVHRMDNILHYLGDFGGTAALPKSAAGWR